MSDRVHQARHRNALEPEWEARFEPKSYGFRPGRSCQDAISVIHVTSCGVAAQRVWVLDADLTTAFDRIDHDHLLATIGMFPGRTKIRDWLKAGVFEPGNGFAPTDAGTPQGGVISPRLLNIALHGLEEAAGVRKERSDPQRTKRGSPSLIRYADDMVALCYTRQQAEQVKARLAAWLAPRGLTFNEDKTRIVHLDDGFDFLGFTARRRNGKLIIKPSKAAVKRVRHRLAVEFRALRGTNPAAVLAKINPIVRGWANYYRGAASSIVFAALDVHLWRLTYKWACHGHPHTPKRWIINRYFGRYNTARQDRWVFGDRTSGAYLPKFAWTKIVRHSLVRGDASPDDPAQAGYWADRRRKTKPLLDRRTLHLLAGKTGPARSADTCSCTPTASHKAPTNGNSGTAPPAGRSPSNTSSPTGQACRTKPNSFTPPAAAAPADSRTQHLCTPEIAQAACLSRVPRRVARTVLRGRRRSNAPSLPDCAGSVPGPASLHHLAGNRPGVRHGTHVPELVRVDHRADRLDPPAEHVERQRAGHLAVTIA
ncbi:MAG TPA: reverse transcriptase domain-containing protein [Actinophytocola sp.]|uniref:reverse transcriptase domain-containing protein n=1 Tax=Actinophytocola sp. TaxID=1872138 RepID=UPI002E0B96C8|nr:reverse transcriptase domain-containing protein [Actinophytocola sp.]